MLHNWKIMNHVVYQIRESVSHDLARVIHFTHSKEHPDWQVQAFWSTSHVFIVKSYSHITTAIGGHTQLSGPRSGLSCWRVTCSKGSSWLTELNCVSPEAKIWTFMQRWHSSFFLLKKTILVSHSSLHPEVSLIYVRFCLILPNELFQCLL